MQLHLHTPHIHLLHVVLIVYKVAKSNLNLKALPLLFINNLTFLAKILASDLARYYMSNVSLSAAFIVRCTERSELFSKLQVQGCMLIMSQKIKSAVIELAVRMVIFQSF